MTGSKSAAGRAAADAGRGQENKAALDNTRKWSPEARSTTRLFEAWFQQKLFDDRLSIRLGQLSADTEFIISPSATLFVNSTFGFPTIYAVDLPSGGPEYPLATPGVRIKIDPNPQLSLLAAVFNGDPAGPGAADPESRNRYGLNFRIKDPPFIIGEAQFHRNTKSNPDGRRGTIKLGGWYHAENFDNVMFGTDGLSLASGNGIPERMPGNWGVYGIIDQQIWRMPGSDEDKGVNVFARLSASPPDRNQISFTFDGGITFDGVILGRSDDVFGLGFSYSRISPSLSALDRDTLRAGTYTLVHDYESLVEFSYRAQIIPGWTIQPDVQYMWHPGGRVPINSAPGAPAIPNATIVGVRTVINY
jgi:porin